MQGEPRNFVTFASADGILPASLLNSFRANAMALAGPIPIAVQSALLDRDHDFSAGSDHLFLVDSFIHKAAAEVFAAERLLSGQLARLTAFHHARALYEGHALAHWLFQDFDARWLRVIKDTLYERDRLEAAYRGSIGELKTDITPLGRSTLADESIKPPPRVYDQAKSKAILRYDYATFWKYSSAHIHPAHIVAESVTPETERTTIEQIVGAIIRHAAGTYREIVDHYGFSARELDTLLPEAEAYGRYPFDLPALPDAEP